MASYVIVQTLAFTLSEIKTGTTGRFEAEKAQPDLAYKQEDPKLRIDWWERGRQKQGPLWR